MVVGYVLCNQFGEVLVIDRYLEETVARELIEAGWVVYRGILEL